MPMTERELALAYYSKVRERQPAEAEIADFAAKHRAGFFKSKADFGAYMYLLGFVTAQDARTKPCACEGMEDLLKWVDPTQEYNGVEVTCSRCGREIMVPTVRELEEVDELDDLNRGSPS
jgi:hypothetical protein